MRKQYHFRRASTHGFLAWDIERLIELSKDLPLREIEVNSITELDQAYWFQSDKGTPTCRTIIKHAKLIQEADLSYPIILSEEGKVMDGMHRVAKAVLEELKIIKAVQFKSNPQPDYINVHPDDLPY